MPTRSLKFMYRDVILLQLCVMCWNTLFLVYEACKTAEVCRDSQKPEALCHINPVTRSFYVTGLPLTATSVMPWEKICCVWSPHFLQRSLNRQRSVCSEADVTRLQPTNLWLVGYCHINDTNKDQQMAFIVGPLTRKPIKAIWFELLCHSRYLQQD